MTHYKSLRFMVLFFISSGSLITSAPLSWYELSQRIKCRVVYEVKQCIKCIKRDKDRDPWREKVYAGTTAGALLFSAGAGAAIFALTKMKKKGDDHDGGQGGGDSGNVVGNDEQGSVGQSTVQTDPVIPSALGKNPEVKKKEEKDDFSKKPTVAQQDKKQDGGATGNNTNDQTNQTGQASASQTESNKGLGGKIKDSKAGQFFTGLFGRNKQSQKNQ